MEVARLFRTARWLGLLASYLVFGILMPVVTRYQEALFKNVGGGIEITAPRPTPPLAIASFVGNVSQIGLVVTIFIAAGSLAFDAHPEWAAFLRTRASVGRILVPKFTVNAAAAIAVSWWAAAAWVGTTLLIAGLPVGGCGGILWGSTSASRSVVASARRSPGRDQGPVSRSSSCSRCRSAQDRQVSAALDAEHSSVAHPLADGASRTSYGPRPLPCSRRPPASLRTASSGAERSSRGRSPGPP
jgi:hypothetical protein